MGPREWTRDSLFLNVFRGGAITQKIIIGSVLGKSLGSSRFGPRLYSRSLVTGATAETNGSQEGARQFLKTTLLRIPSSQSPSILGESFHA
jgi:hypothetical protein